MNGAELNQGSPCDAPPTRFWEIRKVGRECKLAGSGISVGGRPAVTHSSVVRILTNQDKSSVLDKLTRLAECSVAKVVGQDHVIYISGCWIGMVQHESLKVLGFTEIASMAWQTETAEVL